MNAKEAKARIERTRLTGLFGDPQPLRVAAERDLGPGGGTDLHVERKISGYGWQPIGWVRVYPDGRVSYGDLQVYGPTIPDALAD